MPQPDIQGFFDQLCSAGGYDTGALCWYDFALAAGLVRNTANPPYTLTQFLTIYAKFGGVPTFVTGDLTTGSAVIANVSSTIGLAAGQLIAGSGVTPDGAIVSLTSNSITLNAPATVTQAGIKFAVFTNPFVPLAVLQLYLNLANASILFAVYGQSWVMAMALMIAHYATLWLQSEGSTITTAGAAATSGLQLGFVTSKAVGDVSKSIEALGYAEAMGTLGLTIYGQQLFQMSRMFGAGSIYVR
jgi:hypothetical protein